MKQSKFDEPQIASILVEQAHGKSVYYPARTRQWRTALRLSSLFSIAVWLLCPMLLLGQNTMPNEPKSEHLHETYLAIKVINVTSSIWDLGTLDYSFDGVVKHVYSASFPKNKIFDGPKLNDTIRNIAYQADAKDTLVENQIYNAHLTFNYPMNDSTYIHSRPDVVYFPSLAISSSCNDLSVCHTIETRDTLEKGKKIVITTTYHKKYSPTERKLLPDLYSDMGYSTSRTTIWPKAPIRSEKQIRIYFQSGHLASEVNIKKRSGVEKKTVWDENGKKVESSRSTFGNPVGERGFETKGTKYTWYFRKNGKPCLKREIIYNYSSYEQ